MRQHRGRESHHRLRVLQPDGGADGGAVLTLDDLCIVRGLDVADDGTVELRADALLDRKLLFPAPRFVIGRLITVTVTVRITR